jgi:ornithine cyclodeaminase
MALLLTDDEVRDLLPMKEAIKAVRAAFRERVGGTAASPLRQSIPGGPGRLVLTPGGLGKRQRAGLRVYSAGYSAEAQLTVVWNTETGDLDGVVLGDSLGVLRTGAIGGCAFQLLAPETVTKVAVIGAGPQALSQLEALLAVRQIDWVEVCRRDTSKLPATAAEWRDTLGVSVTPAANAESAVRGADVVITATNAATPVVDPEWVLPGTHISCLGPKSRGRSELHLELAAKADVIASDFPEQYASEDDFILAGTPEQKKIQDLARLLAGSLTRETKDLTLFLSHGLAGTEIAVAAAAIEKARQRSEGIPLPGYPE